MTHPWQQNTKQKNKRNESAIDDAARTPRSGKKRERDTVLEFKMWSSKNVSMNVAANIEEKMQRKNVKEAGDTIMNTESEKLNNESSGPETTEKSSELPKGRTTGETEPSISESCTISEESKTLLEGSTNIFPTLEKATLASTSLIDDSCRHLSKLAKGLFTKEEVMVEEGIRVYDPSRVDAACRCYDQIHKLLKVKVDAVKAIKELTK